MGTASTGTHPAPAAPWPHAVIQNAAATLFAEAAARSALAVVEAGANETAAQALLGASSITARAPAELSAAEHIDGINRGGATPVHHDAGLASHVQQDVQQPAMTSEDGSGPSTRDGPAHAREELRPERTGAASQIVMPYREEPELASAAAPAAGNAAGAAAGTAIPESPAAEPVAAASGGVEVTMSMWQIYCDAAQDLLTPGAPALRGRSMEGLRRVRVASAANVQVPSVQLSLQSGVNVIDVAPCMRFAFKLNTPSYM